MICENCSKEHKGKYGSGRFCSSKCARGFSTKAKRKEINERVSKKFKTKQLKNHLKNIECPICKSNFKQKRKNQKVCSKKCSTENLRTLTYFGHDKVNWSEVNKRSYAEGKNYVAGGTTKWIKYKDIKVQGSYELNTCKILDYWKEKGKIQDWEYTNDRVQYIGQDKKEHSYLIDFKVFQDNKNFYYLETKGRIQENDKLKWAAVKNAGFKLIIWFEEDIKNNLRKINTP